MRDYIYNNVSCLTPVQRLGHQVLGGGPRTGAVVRLDDDVVLVGLAEASERVVVAVVGHVVHRLEGVGLRGAVHLVAHEVAAQVAVPQLAGRGLEDMGRACLK